MKKSRLYLGLLGCAAVCFALCGVLLVGRAQAHYVNKQEFTVTLSQEALCPLYLHTASGSTADWQRKNFTLSNFPDGGKAGQTDLQAQIYLFATAGIASGDNLTVTLQYNGQSYTGTAQEIQEGTELYRCYGAGWRYVFLDAQGQELNLSFPAKEQMAYPFSICVETNESIPYSSMLTVRAVGQMVGGEE